MPLVARSLAPHEGCHWRSPSFVLSTAARGTLSTPILPFCVLRVLRRRNQQLIPFRSASNSSWPRPPARHLQVLLRLGRVQHAGEPLRESAGLSRHRRILLATALDRGRAGAPFLGRHGVHDCGYVLAAAPPGGLVWGSSACEGSEGLRRGGTRGEGRMRGKTDVRHVWQVPFMHILLYIDTLDLCDGLVYGQ